MPELLIVGGCCGLAGMLLGWLIGHSAGFTDGVEHEKRTAIKGAKPDKLLF